MAGEDREMYGEERCSNWPREFNKTWAEMNTDAKNRVRWKILVEALCSAEESRDVGLDRITTLNVKIIVVCLVFCIISEVPVVMTGDSFLLRHVGLPFH
jgi:hypothetical protein